MPLRSVRSVIGTVEVIQVIETQIGHLLSGLIPDITPESVREIDWLAAPYRNDDYSLNAVSQCFVVAVKGRTVLIDTCIGNDKNIDEVAEWNNLHTDFLHALEQTGVDRSAVTDVLCTHLHVDHVGWNTYRDGDRWLPTFPNAKYHFAKSEYDYWRQSRAADESGSMQSISFEESIDPIVEAGLANFIETTADLGDGISVFPTPGHTHSHVCVSVDAGPQRFVIAGDVMHHPCQIARPHWATVADYDKDQSTRTRQALFAQLADTNTLIAGTHFTAPSFGTIVTRPDGEFMFASRASRPTSTTNAIGQHN